MNGVGKGSRAYRAYRKSDQGPLRSRVSIMINLLSVISVTEAGKIRQVNEYK